MTGCGPDQLDSTSSATTPTCNMYNTQLGVLASTTHNVYGIYDLAGGVWEYTIGNYVTGSGSAADAYTPTPASFIKSPSDFWEGFFLFYNHNETRQYSGIISAFLSQMIVDLRNRAEKAQ
jgi:hypothetical protein